MQRQGSRVDVSFTRSLIARRRNAAPVAADRARNTSTGTATLYAG